ncbi:mrvi1 protein [Branchiostoma belcheri]|nr:mrvi1 protein [Branchiostoma belcheri]
MWIVINEDLEFRMVIEMSVSIRRNGSKCDGIQSFVPVWPKNVKASFEQGLRAQVSKTLLELREQQKELSDSVELLLEEEEEDGSSDRENGTFISSMYETITAQFLPGWRRKQHIWRLVVTGIICMAALLSVIYAFLPSRRGVVEENMT